MKRITFWNGIVIALFAGVMGSIGFFALTLLLSEDFAIRLLISGLAFAYILYLLSHSPERTGRITVMLIWFVLLATLWLFYPPLTLFLTLHVLVIWLIRSLYFYTRLFSFLADLGLNVLSIFCACWALHHTDSVFLTFWCFFLVQALFALIPTGIRQPNISKTTATHSETDFKRAYQTAEAAVSKLSTYN